MVTNLNEVVLFRIKQQSQTQDLIELLAQEGIAPLAYWTSAHHKVELAFTVESQKQVQNLLVLHSDALAISDISISNELGLVALVSADAEHYRRSFARLLSRDAKPLYQDGLSLVTLVPKTQVNLLTQKVHRRCAGPRMRIGVLLLGVGNIGEAWIDLFQRSSSALNRELEATVQLVGLLSSKEALICSQGIDISNWQDSFDTTAKAWDYPSLFEQLEQVDCDELVALDISASASLTL